MRGISCAETFSSIGALPLDGLALIDKADDLFAGRPWWDLVLAHAMPAGAEASFVLIRVAGQVAALLPMLRDASTRRFSGLTTPYTCQYIPYFATRLDAAARVEAMAVFSRFCRSAGIVRLDALPDEWEGLGDLVAGAHQAGLRVLRFDHFGNWFEDVSGLDWSAYLFSRPGALRETIRRRLRRAEMLPDARFDLLTQPTQMDRAAEAFESVYRRSWKEAEPYPTFNVAFMRTMASAGLLRFGVWTIGAEPVAVQIWVVKDGHAVVLKLAHDQAFKTHSPGTVLTALMLRHLLDRERVAQIDFGRGDDAYKQGWATHRRQRIGVLLVNPWHAAGAAELLRHIAGRFRATMQSWR